ncbi:hypothetical protein L0Y49_02200, partial [bacterium]|nr:hypothetical protein [bacterium]
MSSRFPSWEAALQWRNVRYIATMPRMEMLVMHGLGTTVSYRKKGALCRRLPKMVREAAAGMHAAN